MRTFASVLVGLGSFYVSGYGFESSVGEGVFLATTPLLFYTLGLLVMKESK